ncbi:MAG: hypothetical protein EXX96DRAFT_594345 [Benjaminiella poitrasii]|nr:MAG: hypothetical protein EXX96DRAFT_594345 [Benjaminiella poitrasii]
MFASDINNKRRNKNLTIVATKYSQSTPTSHSFKQEDPPYSPAESTSSFLSSISGIAEKSASELGSLLRNTYRSLKEKEKNLYIAAELGKVLLEHNQILRSDCDKLLRVIREFQRETVGELNEDENSDMRLISSKKAYDTIIESLERKNAEIEALLEHTQQHTDSTNQSHLQKQRKLESEIQILKNDLDLAALKVQELEEHRQLQQDRIRQLDNRRELEQQRIEDTVLLEQLTSRMKELCLENKQLQTSKKTVEEKLLHSLNDLELLRKDFENFELTHQNYIALQEAFERQRIHIQELNESLEDHRLILSRLRDKALWSPHLSDAPSLSTGGDLSAFSTCASKQSLMGELEDAWAKNQTDKTPKPKTTAAAGIDCNLSTLSSKICDFAHLTERNLMSFCNAPADYALEAFLSTVGIENRSILDEAERFLRLPSHEYELFEPESNGITFVEHGLYPSMLSTPPEEFKEGVEQPRKGLLNRILFHIRYLIRSLLRWCRYAIILAAALFLNLWKGPDLISVKRC